MKHFVGDVPGPKLGWYGSSEVRHEPIMVKQGPNEAVDLRSG